MELTALDMMSARPEGDPDNNNGDNEEEEENREVNRGNGNHLDTLEPLLQPTQGAESNGGHSTADVESSDTSGSRRKMPTMLKILKEDLNEPVFWKIKFWMALLVLLLVIICIILLLIFLCPGEKEDADEKYDRLLFVVPLNFTGSFRMANYSYMQDPVSQSDSELFINLSQKLIHVYRSSHALERYFSSAEIETMRRNNATVQFKLEFKMPEENKQLQRFTLSREMVYHVLLQNLVDQDTEDQLYIEPYSLSMEMVDN